MVATTVQRSRSGVHRFRADRAFGAGALYDHLRAEGAIRPLPLAQHALRELSPIDDDLLWVFAAIIQADRSIKRCLRDGWSRPISMEVDVFELDRWRSPPVHSCLHDLLTYATGDDWHIEFVARSDAPTNYQPLPFLAPDGPGPIIVPFSGGVDSWATVAGASAADRRSMLLVRVGRGDHPARAVAEGLGAKLLNAHLGVQPPHHREPTYRTRSLGFFVHAAWVARLFSAREIRIGENGQGAIGPSLVPTGHEHPYVGSHPGLTRRLNNLLMALLESVVPFVHPHLWQTKGEMIRRTITWQRDEDLSALTRTRSCSSDVRRSKQVDLDHCGICGNCLLRRFSLAGTGHDTSAYLFQRLEADELASTHTHSHVKTTKSDLRSAIAAVDSIEAFARFERSPAAEPRLRLAARALSEAGQGMLTENQHRLTRLVQQHAAEWDHFLSTLPRTSFVRQLIGGRP